MSCQDHHIYEKKLKKRTRQLLFSTMLDADMEDCSLYEDLPHDFFILSQKKTGDARCNGMISDIIITHCTHEYSVNTHL